MKYVLTVLAMLIGVAAFGGDTWDFDEAKVTWMPRSASVKLERVAVGAHGGAACLRVSGNEAANWNYAVSNRKPMAAGQAYKLSAWMKVEALPQGTAAPSLKCEFVGPEGGKEIGRVTTSTWEGAKAGQWQELAAQFVAPTGTEGYWLAVEKGGNTPMAIDLLLDDVTVEPIDRVNISGAYALQPLPTRLVQLKGLHPRIYLDKAKVAALREATKTTHAAIWAKLQAQADGLVKKGPPKYLEIDPYSGDEQLYQREVGNAMPTVALAWLITGHQKYLDSARAWALMSCSYPTWGRRLGCP